MLTPAITAPPLPVTDATAETREDVGDALSPFLPTWNLRPRAVPALIPRPRLVRALSDVARPQVAVLVAPAGYGKTTLLLEWSERDKRPFAWVTLSERSNDAPRLLASVRRAVAAVVGDGEAIRPFVLVLDDAHLLHDHRAIEALGTIAADLPPQAKLAIASRTQPPLPISRMRAHRSVTELGSRELAMTRAEAMGLLKIEGHSVGREEVDALLAQTEGWPVAISLASLVLDERGAGSLNGFDGADCLVTRYVRDEVLASLSSERRDFMLCTSVATTLTAPLCDALVGRPGSAATLAALARAGLVVAIDRAEERYRYHRLLGTSLCAELRQAAPELEPDLHRRASAWHRGAGDTDRAIDHALRAGAIDEAADVLWRSLAPVVAEGRTSVVERWLSRFTDGEIAEHATLALTAAGCALLRGQGHTTEHWIAAAERTAGQAPTARAAVAVLRAAIGSPERGAPHDPPTPAAGWRFDDGGGSALGSLIDGMARRLAGDHDGAATSLEAGARRAAVSAPAVHALCLAELAMLALEEDDWEHAAALATRARAQVDRYGLADHAAMALVFAVSALVRAHRGRVDAAHADLGEAVRLRAEYTDFPASTDVEVGLIVARAALRLSDVGRAREQLVDAMRLLRRLPEAITLHAWAADITERLDGFITPHSVAPASMTAAELRILQYLPTHFSFREIGEMTYVSANTVKTQANAVYRKLGVSGRSGAVARARGCGLLDGA